MHSVLVAGLVVCRIVITEVMSNPAGADGASYPEDRNEYVELYNAGGEAVDLYNYQISDGDAVDVIRAWTDSSILVRHPNVRIGTTWLKPGGYAVILDPEYTDPAGLGGFLQPYEFGDSTLIVTVGNTTIGNGLAVNDPVTVFGYEDTSTFGTPRDPADGFPANPGDGCSWERIDIAGPDVRENWAVCPEPAGGTPGRLNAVTARIDVAIKGVEILDSVPPVPGSGVALAVRIVNHSYVPSPAGRLEVRFYPDEPVAEQELPAMGPKQESVFVLSIPMPAVAREVWIRAVVPSDHDTLNNLARVMVSPGLKNRLLSLLYSRFSPDGDGFEDSLMIRYQLPAAGGSLKIRVFNLGAQPVKTLLNRQRIADASGLVWWDGTDEQGGRVAAGVYLIVLDYHRGQERLRAKTPVLVIKR